MNIKTAQRLFRQLESVPVTDDEIQDPVQFEYDVNGRNVVRTFAEGTYLYNIWSFLESACKEFSVYKELYPIEH